MRTSYTVKFLLNEQSICTDANPVTFEDAVRIAHRHEIQSDYARADILISGRSYSRNFWA